MRCQDLKFCLNNVGSKNLTLALVDTGEKWISLVHASKERITLIDTCEERITLVDTGKERVALVNASEKRITLVNACEEGIALIHSGKERITLVNALLRLVYCLLWERNSVLRRVLLGTISASSLMAEVETCDLRSASATGAAETTERTEAKAARPKNFILQAGMSED